MPALAPQPSVTDESFGRRLRRERERRQIALSSMAENSKISVSLFKDLERDDVSRWPSGIFRRSFIRAYAQAVGLDAEATTREFLERFPDRNDPIPSPAPSPAAKSSLRLTLAETSAPFPGGHALTSAKTRLAAIGVDAILVGSLSFTIAMVVGTLWMPLSVTLFAYYAGGILVLGNTPGVCLCASRRNPLDAPREIRWWRRLGSRIVEILPALPSKSNQGATIDCREWPSAEDHALSKL